MVWRFGKRLLPTCLLLFALTAGFLHDAAARPLPSEDDQIENAGNRSETIVSPGAKRPEKRGRPVAAAAMWNELGVPRPRNVFHKEDVYSGGRWSSRLDNNGNAVSVVLLTDRDQDDWQDLVFVRDKEGMTFAGSHNMPKQRGVKPEHRIINGGVGERFLSVSFNHTYVDNCGVMFEEAWLRLHDDLQEAVHFPTKAVACRGTVKGTIVSYSLTGYRQWEISGTHRLELTYTVEHERMGTSDDIVDPEDEPQEEALFVHPVRVRFIWDGSKYVLDTPNTDAGIAAQESPELILDVNRLLHGQRDSFLKLADDGDDAQLEWLKEWLRGANDPDAVKSIEQRIEKRLSRTATVTN